MRVRVLEASSLAALRLRKGVVLFCSASFESRCLTVPLSIRPESVEQAYIFKNAGVGERGEENCGRILEHFGGDAAVFQISRTDPAITADQFSRAILSAGASNIGSIIIDITCFTREALLILVRIIAYKLSMSARIYVMYNKALHYGSAAGRKNWMSRGVSSIRPILGYSGEFISAKPTHLLVLSGFELDRLGILFESVVPAKVTILRSESTLGEARAVSAYRFDVLRSARRRYGEADEIMFKPFSFLDVMNKIDALYSIGSEEYSFVVAPLSTKVSTLGVGFYATLNEKVQVIYTQPSVYNKESYSVASKDVMLYSLTLDDIEKYYSEDIDNLGL